MKGIDLEDVASVIGRREVGFSEHCGRQSLRE